MGSAPYRVMMGIEQYNRLGGLKKELNNTIMNLQMANLVSARQKQAMNTLIKLQLAGMTEDQILKICIDANSYDKNESQLAPQKTLHIIFIIS